MVCPEYDRGRLHTHFGSIFLSFFSFFFLDNFGIVPLTTLHDHCIAWRGNFSHLHLHGWRREKESETKEDAEHRLGILEIKH